MVFDASFLLQRLSYLDSGIEPAEVAVGIAVPDELVECREEQAEVEVVYERFLAVPYVHESGIEAREELLNSSEIDVPHRKAMTLSLFRVVLDEPMVLHKGYPHFRCRHVHYKVFLLCFRFFHWCLI